MEREAGVDTSLWWEYQPGQRVMTREGFPGVVEAVQDGPFAGNEHYVVALDHGFGGGEYSASELSPLETRQSAAVEADVEHTAADDYDNLREVLHERLPSAMASMTKVEFTQPAEDEALLNAVQAEVLGDLTGSIAAVVYPPHAHEDPAASMGIDSARNAYHTIKSDPVLSQTIRGSQAIYAWETWQDSPATVAAKEGFSNAPPHEFEGMPPAYQICNVCDMRRDHPVHVTDRELVTAKIAVHAVVDEDDGVVAGPFENEAIATQVHADLLADGEVGLTVRALGSQHEASGGSPGDYLSHVLGESKRLYDTGVSESPFASLSRERGYGNSNFSTTVFWLAAGWAESKGLEIVLTASGDFTGGLGAGHVQKMYGRKGVKLSDGSYTTFDQISRMGIADAALHWDGSLHIGSTEGVVHPFVDDPVTIESRQLLREAGFDVGAGVVDWINEKLNPAWQIRDLEGETNDWSHDWCRFRTRQHCYFPKDLDKQATERLGEPVWIPFHRGRCPRNKWQDQMECPVSEPGPNSGHPDAGPQIRQSASLTAEAARYAQDDIEADLYDRGYESAADWIAEHDLGAYCDDVAAAVTRQWGYPQVFGAFKDEDGQIRAHSWNVDGDEIIDLTFDQFRAAHGFGPEVYVWGPADREYARYQKESDSYDGWEGNWVEGSLTSEAAWRDVQAKAKRIRGEGGVRIISAPTAKEGGGNQDYVVADVNGDTKVYRTQLMLVPGSRSVAMWECGCPWSAYSWGRSGRWKKYEGRMCAHALALLYEAQSRAGVGEAFQGIPEDAQAPEWAVGVEPQLDHPKPPIPADKGFVGAREAMSMPEPVHVKWRGQVLPIVEVRDGKVRFVDGVETDEDVEYPTWDPSAGLEYHIYGSKTATSRSIWEVPENEVFYHGTGSFEADLIREKGFELPTALTGRGADFGFAAYLVRERGVARHYSRGQVLSFTLTPGTKILDLAYTHVEGITDQPWETIAQDEYRRLAEAHGCHGVTVDQSDPEQPVAIFDVSRLHLSSTGAKTAAGWTIVRDGFIYRAIISGVEIGRLEAIDFGDEDIETGLPQILADSLWVAPEWRRRGVATALYQRLREDFPPSAYTIAHTYRTPEGAAWARALGLEDMGHDQKWLGSKKTAMSAPGVRIVEVDASRVTTTRVVACIRNEGNPSHGDYWSIIGFLSWDPGNLTAEIAWVYHEFRRRGIGRALWKAAEWVQGQSLSPSTERSPMGEAFSESIKPGHGVERDELTPAEGEAFGSRFVVSMDFSVDEDQIIRDVPLSVYSSKKTAMAQAFEDRVGHCYRLAANRVVDKGGTLVHGSIQGMGNPRIGHAWVILPSGEVWDGVLDDSFPPDFHEAYFNTIEYARYDRDETLKMMVTTGHYGPWEGPFVGTDYLPDDPYLAKQAQADSTGVMVALRPPDDVLLALMDTGMVTEDFDNLHVTMGYFGSTDEVDRAALFEAVQNFSLQAPPVTGRIGGYGIFLNDEEKVLWASVNIPGLEDWRERLVDILALHGLEPKKTHGFTAHLTMSWFEGEPPKVPDVVPEGDFTMDEIIIAYGGEWTPYPLVGEPMQVEGTKDTEVTFEERFGDEWLAEGEAIAYAMIDGQDVGAIRWNYLAEPPVVEGITVEEPYRRRGIGTMLFEYAKSRQSGLQHGDVLTDEGHAFVKSLTAEVAPDEDSVGTSDLQCPVCGGSGTLADGTTCWNCNGTGTVQGDSPQQREAVSEWKRTPMGPLGGERSYRTSIVGKNGRTYYITGSFENIEAFTEDPYERVGALQVWKWNGRREIHQIAVKPEHQRQGVATAMLELAREFYPDLVHAQPVALSEDGTAWAQSVGAREAKATFAKTCKICDEPATKAVLWAEGMAYVPACASHVEEAKALLDDPSDVVEVIDISEGEKVANLSLARLAALTPGLWYRVHDPIRRGAPFGPETATSREFGWRRAETQQGYSAYKDPWHLWIYCFRMGWIASKMVQGSEVVAFTGDKVGEGRDGEPLVMPDMTVVRTMSWQQFERELMSFPRPPWPMPDVRSSDWGWNWVAESILDSPQSWPNPVTPLFEWLMDDLGLNGPTMEDRIQNIPDYMLAARNEAVFEEHIEAPLTHEALFEPDPSLRCRAPMAARKTMNSTRSSCSPERG